MAHKPGYFGEYGGAYVPETLVAPLADVAAAFERCQQDASFQAELVDLLKNFAGRPTALTYAARLSEQYHQKIYLKREDLLHGGAHKTNNTIGQGLLAKYMGKTRLIAETGAGQHGVATSMIGALLGLPVTVYMGAIDVARQALNVERMKLFGATVVPVTSGSQTLKDAINDAMRDWLHDSEHTFYVFGTAAGPHPYPSMVRYFQEVIGREARAQMLEYAGQLPDAIYACVGGGSNAIGFFSAFLADVKVKIYGAEASGHGVETDYHAATLNKGTPGIFHGMHSYFLQNADGQITETHSISAGLDYPGIGPEHVYLKETGRINYEPISDVEAVHAFEYLARMEGILPALESAHAVALALKVMKTSAPDSVHLINISGRGDKDLNTYLDYKK
jgi:tryptophan synthase beta chain